MDRIESWLQAQDIDLRKRGRPLVSLCYAQSLDGSLTQQRGVPLALSGSESQILTHWLRASHDAILVGIGTVLADDPQLTVRHVAGKNPQPIVLDSRLRMPLDTSLLSRHPLKPWIATTHLSDLQRRHELMAVGARLLLCEPDARGCVSLVSLLQKLAEMQVKTLMVEGGAATLTSFLVERLADRAVVTIAPRFVGGLPMINRQLFAPVYSMVQAGFPRLLQTGYDACGEDLIVWGDIDYGE